MPQLRQNMVTREWVIFATERARRPEEFRLPHVHRALEAWREDCPFCPGNEGGEGSPELLRLESAPGTWQVRVLPNKYPALSPGGLPRRSHGTVAPVMDGFGHHEVIVESPLHNADLALLEPDRIRLLLQAWLERYRALARQPETEHVIIYKNHGPRAGTSLEHPHSQIVSLPVVPAQVRRRHEEASRFYSDFGQCAFCRMLEHERSEGVRIVSQGRHFTAFIPYAAYSPFHLWLFPHRHACCFSETSSEELDDLAWVLRDTLARYHIGLNDPDHNLVVRSSLRDYVAAAFFHWYLALVPRLVQGAGFEMGTGMFINTSLPENDAGFLRGVRPPQDAAAGVAAGDGPGGAAGPLRPR